MPYTDTQVDTSAEFVPNPSKVFVAHWDPQHLAELSAEFEVPGRLAVVSYDRDGIRLLKQCQLVGVYTAATISPYGGTHGTSDSSTHGVKVAQVAGASVDRAGASALDYVISGRKVANRVEARRSELFGPDCDAATHFVAAVYTGAFVRSSASSASTHAGGGSRSVRAEGSGASGRTTSEGGGNLQRCRSGVGPDNPLCSAAIEIELAPIQESIFAHLELVSYAIGPAKAGGSAWDVGGSDPDPRFIFTTSSGVSLQTGVHQDQGSWAGCFDLQAHELLSGFWLQVQAIDADLVFDDSIGSAVVPVEELRAGGLIRVVLVEAGKRTGEVTLKVTIAPSR